jgi:hypothetical protein
LIRAENNEGLLEENHIKVLIKAIAEAGYLAENPLD